MGAMVRPEGLLACGAGTAAVGQHEVSGRCRPPRTYGCLRDGLRAGLSGPARRLISWIWLVRRRICFARQMGAYITARVIFLDLLAHSLRVCLGRWHIAAWEGDRSSDA